MTFVDLLPTSPTVTSQSSTRPSKLTKSQAKVAITTDTSPSPSEILMDAQIWLWKHGSNHNKFHPMNPLNSVMSSGILLKPTQLMIALVATVSSQFLTKFWTPMVEHTLPTSRFGTPNTCNQTVKNSLTGSFPWTLIVCQLFQSRLFAQNSPALIIPTSLLNLTTIIPQSSKPPSILSATTLLGMLIKYQLWPIAKLPPTFGPSTTETAQITNTADLPTKLIMLLSFLWALTTPTHQLSIKQHSTPTPQPGEFLNALTPNSLVSMEFWVPLFINHLVQFATLTQPLNAQLSAPVLLLLAPKTWLPIQLLALHPQPFFPRLTLVMHSTEDKFRCKNSHGSQVVNPHTTIWLLIMVSWSVRLPFST